MQLFPLVRWSRAILAIGISLGLNSRAQPADELPLSLTFQTETSEGSGRYHRLVRQETWSPRSTAVIVCDVWDLHHSQNAVRRVEQLAPRLDQFVRDARRRGMTIIHAPSDCMDAYADHPARRRAIDTPQADPLPADIRSWCSLIPSEEQAVYPLDQSDGGDDDDPDEHAVWAAELARRGRNPALPWKKQTDLIAIDPQQDYVSDRGDEVWSILQERGITHVILTGVHTNMCVLGRPFGLRQLVRNGKHVVLVRDLTDTMYNPARWPYVSHFTGTDLIVSHIEKFVCPTITSDQLLGGTPLRFSKDTRPHVAMLIAEDEYETERTLPAFAASQLGKQFRVSLIFGSDTDLNDIPGLEALEQADVALISVRRRVLPTEQLDIVRRFVAAGKPVVGIRTASHAFSLRSDPLPTGCVDWPEFDAQVLGGNYHGHHDNELPSTVTFVADASSHPILAGVSRESFRQGGSLYKTSPLAARTVPLMTARAEGHAAEPVAWTYERQDGGRSFYTSLGHVADFDNPQFVHLLVNGIHWAAGLDPADDVAMRLDRESSNTHWVLATLPDDQPTSHDESHDESLSRPTTPTWYRCTLRLGPEWAAGADVALVLPQADTETQVWFNGHPMTTRNDGGPGRQFDVSRDWIQPSDANLLVVRYEKALPPDSVAPRLVAGPMHLELNGRWQRRRGDDPSWPNMPLPARFGTPTDIIFQP